MFKIWSQNDEILIEEFNDTPSNRNNKRDITKLCDTIKNSNIFKFKEKDQNMHLATKNRNAQLSYQNNILFFLENIINLLKKFYLTQAIQKLKNNLIQVH